MKAWLALAVLVLLSTFATGLAACGCDDDDDDGGGTGADDDAADDDDGADDDAADDDNDDSPDDDDDDDTLDDDDDTSDDDAVHEVDRFSANGIDYTLVAGGAPGRYGLSLIADPSGRLCAAVVKARQLYLFTQTDENAWPYEIIALWSAYPDLQVDQAGHRHLVFQDKRNWQVVYATDAGGAWSFTPIASTPYLHASNYPTLALDRDGFVHIIFQNPAAYDLMHATNASGAWQIERLFAFDAVSERPTLAVDDQNRLHVAYQDHMKSKLFHAVGEDGVWRREQVVATTEPGAESQIGLGPDGVIHIAYDAENLLQFASQVGAAWTAETVDSEWSDSISLVLDEAGAACLAYRRPAMFNESSELRFASNSGGEWLTSAIEQGKDVGHPNDILLPPDGVVRIAYYAGEASALKLATGGDGEWDRENIHRADLAGLVQGLALNDAAQARLVYYDFQLAQYVQGTERPTGWEFVELAAPAGVAYRSSWILAPDDEIHVLYTTSTPGPVSYARFADGEWTTEQAASRAFWFTTPALDENGAIHFAYRPANPLDWRYVTNASGAWMAEPMDVRPTPVYPAFAYANGTPHAAYVGEADEQVVHAWRENGTWREDVVVAADTADRVEGIAVDGDDVPHILYSVKDFYVGYHLRYLTQRDDHWEVEEIIETDNSRCVFALDEANRVHALFFDIVGDDVMYATNASGQWTTAVIDEVGQSGATVALVLRGDNVHAAYSDENAVWYAVFAQGYGGGLDRK